MPWLTSFLHSLPVRQPGRHLLLFPFPHDSHEKHDQFWNYKDHIQSDNPDGVTVCKYPDAAENTEKDIERDVEVRCGCENTIQEYCGNAYHNPVRKVVDYDQKRQVGADVVHDLVAVKVLHFKPPLMTVI